MRQQQRRGKNPRRLQIDYCLRQQTKDELAWLIETYGAEAITLTKIKHKINCNIRNLLFVVFICLIHI